VRHQFFDVYRDSALKKAVVRRRWRNHHNAAVSIRFNTSFDFEPCRLRVNFIPTAQIESHLLFTRTKFQRNC
jgi:hypothetical protein